MIGIGTFKIGDIGYFKDEYGHEFFGIIVDKITKENQEELFKKGYDLLIVDLKREQIVALTYFTHTLVKLTDKEYYKLKSLAIETLKLSKVENEFLFFISGATTLYSTNIKLEKCRLLDIDEEFFPE